MQQAIKGIKMLSDALDKYIENYKGDLTEESIEKFAENVDYNPESIQLTSHISGIEDEIGEAYRPVAMKPKGTMGVASNIELTKRLLKQREERKKVKKIKEASKSSEYIECTVLSPDGTEIKALMKKSSRKSLPLYVIPTSGIMLEEEDKVTENEVGKKIFVSSVDSDFSFIPTPEMIGYDTVEAFFMLENSEEHLKKRKG